MKFGRVDNPEIIDFRLPEDHTSTHQVLNSSRSSKKTNIFIGCAKWNRQDIKNFYPRGTRDELAYYASQFNTIELNATFYRIFPDEQVTIWKEKTPADFRFYPKVSQMISHWRRLKDAESLVEEHCHSIRFFGEKLGGTFLQMPDNFKPKDFDRIPSFLSYFPKDIPLALELRNTAWFNDHTVANELYDVLDKQNVINVITDTAGRRDLLHMRLTSRDVVVRYVGANHGSDYARLDEWLERIQRWSEQGMKNLYFFVHQNLERESPHLSAYLIERLNSELGFELTVPKTLPFKQVP